MAEHKHTPSVPYTDPEWLGVGAVISVCETCGAIVETRKS